MCIALIYLQPQFTIWKEKSLGGEYAQGGPICMYTTLRVPLHMMSSLELFYLLLNNFSSMLIPFSISRNNKSSSAILCRLGPDTLAEQAQARMTAVI
jgi:hypothetical protein